MVGWLKRGLEQLTASVDAARTAVMLPYITSSGMRPDRSVSSWTAAHQRRDARLLNNPRIVDSDVGVHCSPTPECATPLAASDRCRIGHPLTDRLGPHTHTHSARQVGLLNRFCIMTLRGTTFYIQKPFPGFRKTGIELRYAFSVVVVIIVINRVTIQQRSAEQGLKVTHVIKTAARTISMISHKDGFFATA